MDMPTRGRDTAGVKDVRNHIKLRRAAACQQALKVLSPLILSPYADIEGPGFVLEEPFHVNGEHYKRGQVVGRCRNSGSKIVDLTPADAKLLGRSNVGETEIRKKRRSQAHLGISASTSRRTTQGSRLAWWATSSNNASSATEDAILSAGEKGKGFGVSSGESRLTSASWMKPGSTTDDDITLSTTNGMELMVLSEPLSSRSLSLKYRPKLFEELVGQDLVTRALSNAVRKGKIAPVYLFYGPRGTGKTSAARILAAALNCRMASVDQGPCTVCGECKAIAMGKSPVVWEVDASSYNGVDNLKALLEGMLLVQPCSSYRVFIIDECHMLSNETWNALLKFLEEPPGDFVSVLITTEFDRLPRTASSRCQKFSFTKVKNADILKRLIMLVSLERLDVEAGALEIIASQSDGSLRDAEMMLDQLSLCGLTISRNAVLDLVGSVSDEKLLHLLNLALSSNTVRTVKKAKELVHSGVEPLDLTTRLARLITDILAGSYTCVNKEQHQFVSRHTRSKEGVEGLRVALKILLETERQLRTSPHDKGAWLTAALLQFRRHRPLPRLLFSSSTSAATSPMSQKSTRSLKTYEPRGLFFPKWANPRGIFNKMSPSSEDSVHGSAFKPETRPLKPNFETRIHPTAHPFLEDDRRDLSSDSSVAISSPFSTKGSERRASFLGPGNLGSIWMNILRGCKSLPLRHLLSHGKLLAVCFSTAEAMVHLEFKDPEHKSRAERYRNVIANMCKKGLGYAVDVKISLATVPGGEEEAPLSVLSLLAKRTPVRQDRSEDLVNFRLEGGKEIDTSDVDVGSLHHWRSHSGVPLYNPMTEHTCFSHKVPFHRASLSGDILPAFGGCLDVCRSEPYICQERLNPAWVYDYNEPSQVKAGYLQESRLVRQLQGTPKQWELVSTEAILTLKLANGFHAQECIESRSPPVCDTEKTLNVNEPKDDDQNLRTPTKHGGLLCWRLQKERGGKQERSQCPRGKCGALITFMPCARAKSP